MSQDPFVHLLALASQACEHGDRLLAARLAGVLDEVESSLPLGSVVASTETTARTALPPLDLPVVVARRAAHLHRVVQGRDVKLSACVHEVLHKALAAPSEQPPDPGSRVHEPAAVAGTAGG